jgi:hypothetical protein
MVKVCVANRRGFLFTAAKREEREEKDVVNVVAQSI